MRCIASFVVIGKLPAPLRLATKSHEYCRLTGRLCAFLCLIVKLCILRNHHHPYLSTFVCFFYFIFNMLGLVAKIGCRLWGLGPLTLEAYRNWYAACIPLPTALVTPFTYIQRAIIALNSQLSCAHSAHIINRLATMIHDSFAAALERQATCGNQRIPVVAPSQ